MRRCSIDARITKLARILVEHSIDVQAGDRVMIEATTAAEPLVLALFEQILERGGHPFPLLTVAGEEEAYFRRANSAQLAMPPVFLKLAAEEFEARIRIASQVNTRALSGVDPARQAERQKTLGGLTQTVMKRSAAGKMKWAVTLFPTQAYAMQAGMGLQEYEDFVYRACHADEATLDPAAYWLSVREKQKRYIARLEGHDRVRLRGPNVDLALSVKGRTFRNSHGRRNMPDGEFFTGPIEESVNGWVRYTFPSIYAGRIVEGIRLEFVEGKVVKATAEREEELLLRMIESDAGARFVGEFAIGTNYQIDRFTGSVLFDEKIGGAFHMALGNGYPETGSRNVSVIHWDMVCDLRKDSEIEVDGEVVYRNGQFVG